MDRMMNFTSESATGVLKSFSSRSEQVSSGSMPTLATVAAALGALSGLGLLYKGYRSRKTKINKSEVVEEKLVLRSENERVLRYGNISAVHVFPAALGSDQASPSSLPPIVLVHGIWHSSWYYRAVQNILAAEGYESYAVRLNSAPFKTLSSHVNDLHSFFKALKLRRPVLVGHSQGGIIVQQYMHTINSTMEEKYKIRGVILLGTAAIGHTRLVWKMIWSIISSCGFYKFFSASWRLHVPSVDTMKAFFTLKSTTYTTITGKAIMMEDYFTLLRTTPADGYPTYVSHPYFCQWIFKTPPPFNVPSLVAHFEHDVTYRVYHAQANVKLHGSDFLFVPGQAHCFLDPGWEKFWAVHIVRWIKTKVT